MVPVAANNSALRSLILTSALLWAWATHAQADNTDVIAAALQRLDAAAQDKAWFFTLHLTENEESRLISHDPLRDPYQQRTLLQIDGESPDADSLDEFRKAEKKRVDDSDPEAGYSRLVDMQSLQLSSVEGNSYRYTFSPRIEALDKVRDKLHGALTLDTGTGQILDIEVFNTEPFSPAFSVTLESYKLEFLFREEQGARLLQRMESTAVGKAGFFKEFESVVVVDFSDYRPADATTTD